MDDLIAFLNARLDEREAKALDAVQESPTWGYDYQGLVEGGDNVWSGLTEFSRHGDQLGEFIAANDPAFVLADVAAKRQIINLAYSKCGADSAYADGWDDAALWAAKALALPDAGHPDYREEWKP